MSEAKYTCKHGCCHVVRRKRGFGGRPISVNNHHFATLKEVAEEYQQSYDTVQTRMQHGRCLMMPVDLKRTRREEPETPPLMDSLMNKWLVAIRVPGEIERIDRALNLAGRLILKTSFARDPSIAGEQLNGPQAQNACQGAP